MNEHNHIDDIFKRSLGNFAEQPSDELWLEVEKKLWLKKLLRKAFYIGSGLITVAAIILIALLFVNKQEQTQKKTNIAAVEVKQHNNKDINVETHTNSYLEENKTTPLNNKKTDSKDIQKNLSQNTSVHTTKNTAQTISAKKTDRAQSPVIQEKTENETNIPNKSAVNESQKETMVENIITETLNNESTINSNDSDVSVSENPNENNKGVENKQINTEPQLIIPAVTPPVAPPVAPPIQKTKLKPVFEAMVFIMPSYVSKTMSGISQQEIDFRKNHEKNQLFLNYGADFRVRLNNFYIQSGILQTQSGEKNNYKDKYLKQIDTTGSYYDVFTTSHPDPQNPGNTIITFDSTWVHVSDSSFAEVNLNSVNTIKYFEIPLNIGYVFNTGNHQLGLNGGLSCGLLSQVKIAMVDKETYTVTSYERKDNIFNRAIWSYNISLNYAYSLSGNTSLFVQTGYRKNLKSVFTGLALQQQYSFIDTKVGIMFKF